MLTSNLVLLVKHSTAHLDKSLTNKQPQLLAIRARGSCDLNCLRYMNEDLVLILDQTVRVQPFINPSI